MFSQHPHVTNQKSAQQRKIEARIAREATPVPGLRFILVNRSSWSEQRKKLWQICPFTAANCNYTIMHAGHVYHNLFLDENPL
jgi:hypothetical protein